MKNYYDILGVPKTATKDEIKKVFRKLAIENHPDKGGEKDKFQVIQEAYEILGNEEKRRQYDSGQLNQNSNGMSNFEFFFNHHNRRNEFQKIKKSNHMYNIDITLREVHFGFTKKIKVKREKNCKTCYINCNNCDGNGEMSRTVQMGPFIQHITQRCNICNGAGINYSNNNECNNSKEKCKNGRITEEKIFEIEIPKGVEQNKQFIYSGWGEQAIKQNEIPGDLIICINIKPDNVFKRNNLNLIYENKCTLKESIIGKDVQINIFDEILNINTKIFGILNPNKQYIIYGKGLNGENNGKNIRGDLYITVKIEYPEKTLNDDQINKLKLAFDEIQL